MPGLNTIYRPQNLDDIIGNESVLKSLKSILEKPKEKMHQCFLLTGPSGCGKTSIARIMAKELGSYDYEKKVNIDYTEFDAGIYGGISNIRDLLKSINLKAFENEWRIYLLDEVHCLSKAACESLLKSLEHPPKHTIFILATTDPEKLLLTMKRRCTIFELQSLSNTEIKNYITRIGKKEGKRIHKDVATQIAKDANGSIGIALTILDKIINLDPGDMLEECYAVGQIENQAIELCRAFTKNINWTEITNILRGLRKENPEKIRRSILGYMTSILLTPGKEPSPQISIVLDEFENMSTFNSGFSSIVNTCIKIYYEIKGD